jgi:hypothetical protein
MFLNSVYKSLESEISLRKKVVKTLEQYPERGDIISETAGLEFCEVEKRKLENAVQFYTGSNDKWNDVLKKFEGVPLFNNTDIHLPYNPSCFCFTINEGKVKVCAVAWYVSKEEAEGNSDCLDITLHFKDNNRKDWFHYALRYRYILHGNAAQFFNSDHKMYSHFRDSNETNIIISSSDREHEQIENQNKDLVVISSSLIYATLQFLSCKNSVTEYVYSVKPKMFNKLPQTSKNLYRYKVLKVLVPKQSKTYISDAKKAPSLTQMPVHLVLGHMKTYTEERKLFGKYVGTWWWQPYVKGNPENGFIGKEYHVISK